MDCLFGVKREEFRQVVSQGCGDDSLGRAGFGSNGAEPGAEVAPDEAGDGRCECDEDALGDESELDEAVVGVEFCADGVAVVLRFAVHVLVAAPALDGGHGAHPEVVGEGAQNVKGVLEGDLDLEAQAVEADDFEGRQFEIGAHEQAFSARGVIDSHEPHKAGDGPPEQVDGA